MLSIPSLRSLLRPLILRIVAPGRVLSMGQIKLIDIICVQTKDLFVIELFERELFVHLTVHKHITDV